MTEVKPGGFHGTLHTAPHVVADEKQAYIVPAKAMAIMVMDLLADGAKEAGTSVANFIPKMTKSQYLT
ncbi:MAG: hypothetical protein ABSD47_20600 [Candidatus Methylomirabilota bacterium]